MRQVRTSSLGPEIPGWPSPLRWAMAGAHESRWHCIFPGMFSFGLTQKQFDLESDKGIPSPRDLFSWQQFWLEIYLLAQKEKNRVILSKLYNQTGQPSLNEGLMLESAPFPTQHEQKAYYWMETITCVPAAACCSGNNMLCLCPITATSLISDLEKVLSTLHASIFLSVEQI